MAESDQILSERVFLNGRIVPLHEARVSPLDRGFLYGDGIFTTMRAENGQVLYLNEHLNRLRQSLLELRLNPDLPLHDHSVATSTKPDKLQPAPSFLQQRPENTRLTPPFSKPGSGSPILIPAVSKGNSESPRLIPHLPKGGQEGFLQSSREIIDELLQQNNLTTGTAAVKIVVTRGISAQLGLPTPEHATVFIHARRYDPPAPSTYRKGWRLHVFRDGFAPPLARYKSLNYLYYLTARQAALDAGANEAVVLDNQCKVTETAAGSLLLRTAGQWWTPVSPYQLSGITLAQVIKMLEETGQTVEKRSADAEELFSAETIWVLNSLLGIMPVSGLEGSPIAQPAPEEAGRLRELLFTRGRNV
jgi:branched-chain amino acid aminotransferase